VQLDLQRLEPSFHSGESADRRHGAVDRRVDRGRGGQRINLVDASGARANVELKGYGRTQGRRKLQSPMNGVLRGGILQLDPGDERSAQKRAGDAERKRGA
jgi:hypothetical protein